MALRKEQLPDHIPNNVRNSAASIPGSFQQKQPLSQPQQQSPQSNQKLQQPNAALLDFLHDNDFSSQRQPQLQPVPNSQSEVRVIKPGTNNKPVKDDFATFNFEQFHQINATNTSTQSNKVIDQQPSNQFETVRDHNYDQSKFVAKHTLPG